MIFFVNQTPIMIVLPIKRNTYHWNRNEFLRFKKIGLKSLERFLDPSICILLIVPGNQIDDAKQTIVSDILQLKFVVEEKYVDITNIRGWTKQMLLKLAIAEHIDVTYYLVLDADCILTKKLSVADLLYQGRMIGCKEKYHDVDSRAFAVSTHWWRNSHRFLDPFMVEIPKGVNLMSVTPEVFITKEVRDMLSKLKGRHGSDWQQVFCSSGATEFCTYWLHLMEEGKTHLYDLSDQAPSLWTMDLCSSWLYNDSAISLRETIENGFKSKDFFMVIQSHTDVEIDVIVDIIDCLALESSS
jgi:hypothetical protein